MLINQKSVKGPTVSNTDTVIKTDINSRDLVEKVIKTHHHHTKNQKSYDQDFSLSQ